MGEREGVKRREEKCKMKSGDKQKERKRERKMVPESGPI